MVPVPIPQPDQGRPKQRPAAHTPGDARRNPVGVSMTVPLEWFRCAKLRDRGDQ